MKNEEKLKKVVKWAFGLTAAGLAATVIVLLKTTVDQKAKIDRLEGENKNMKDMNRGLTKTIERLNFVCGKQHVQLHGEG